MAMIGKSDVTMQNSGDIDCQTNHLGKDHISYLTVFYTFVHEPMLGDSSWF